ncbi:MAG: S8 family serine peptidase, partial [Thermococcus sp.]|nr:S8 family serine peptidase [Thermococcus sp.]
MDRNIVKLIGVFLIVLGGSCLISSLNITKNVAIGYYSMVKSFPMSVASPQEKISKTLKEELSKAKPSEKIPVVVVLTGDTGAMAIAQQEMVLPSLQAVGFQMTMSITDVANALAGTVPADKVDELASNPYVEKVLYDGKLFKITSDVPTVKLLKDSVPMIHAPEVWAEGYTGQGVVVIIIDSGVQNNHPWLMRNGKSLVIDEKVIVPNAHDYTHWHGTHCAGIIASQDSNYRGVAPGIDGFVDIVAFDWQGSARLSWILEALDYAYKKAKELKAQGKAVVSTN